MHARIYENITFGQILRIVANNTTLLFCPNFENCCYSALAPAFFISYPEYSISSHKSTLSHRSPSRGELKMRINTKKILKTTRAI